MRYAFAIAITALLTAGGSDAAGWTGELWEENALFRGLQYTSTVPATRVREVITVTSTTNYIPETVYWPYQHQGEFSIISTSRSLPETRTNQITQSRAYYYRYFDLRDIGTASTNYYTAQRTFVVEGVTNELTITHTAYFEHEFYTMNLTAEHQRFWELYQAISERWIIRNLPHMRYYCLQNPLAAQDYKNAVKMLLEFTYRSSPFFVNPIAFTRTDLSPYFSNFPYYSASDLLAVCSLPPNYFDYTPPKFPWGHSPYGREVETCATIAALPQAQAGNADYTNTIHLYNGSTTNIVGKFGKKVCVKCINTNVVEGFTENDYSLQHLTNILSRLHIVLQRNVDYLVEKSGSGALVHSYNNVYNYKYGGVVSTCSETEIKPFGPPSDYDSVYATNHTVDFTASATGEKSRGSGGRDIQGAGYGARSGSSDGHLYGYTFRDSKIIGGTFRPNISAPTYGLFFDYITSCSCQCGIAFAKSQDTELHTNICLQPVNAELECIHPAYSCSAAYLRNRIDSSCCDEEDVVITVHLNDAFPENSRNLHVIGSPFTVTFSEQSVLDNSVSFTNAIAFPEITANMRSALQLTPYHSYSAFDSIEIDNVYGETGTYWLEVYAEFFDQTKRVDNHATEEFVYLDYKTDGGFKFQ